MNNEKNPAGLTRIVINSVRRIGARPGPDASQLNFGSIRNGSIAELHRFAGLSGTVTDAGKATIKVNLVSGGSFGAYSIEPSYLNAEDFGLLAGIDKLREIAGLESIAKAIPITFSVVFRDVVPEEKAPEEKAPEDEAPEEEESVFRKLLPFGK